MHEQAEDMELAHDFKTQIFIVRDLFPVPTKYLYAQTHTCTYIHGYTSHINIKINSQNHINCEFKLYDNIYNLFYW